MEKEIEINHLASSVIWWLNYISAVGRGYVISESAIKIPAAEYLEKSIADSSDIQLEFNHPKLFMKRFDLYYKKRSIENAFEFKYIKNGSTLVQNEKQRIFNDLMRLFLFLDMNQKGYFLICGDQADFNLSFQKIKQSTSFIQPAALSTSVSAIQSGFYSEWFSFDIKYPQKLIDLTTSDTLYKAIYDDFEVNYATPYQKKTSNTLVLPSTITTKLIFLSQEISDSNIPQTTKIGIWEVNR